MKNKWSTRLFFIVLLLVIWESSVRLFHISPLLFPTVEEVAANLIDGLLSGDLLIQTLYSLGIIGLALVISCILAVLLALLATMNEFAAGFVDTLTALAHPLPGLALLPLIIMWFGTGTGAVTAVVVHSALWPILVNLLSGFRSMPAIYEDIGRSLSMSRAAITLEIRLKASLGDLLSGLKIGWARGWRAFISAEMVFGAAGAYGGIGWYIMTQRTFMNTAGLFSGIIIVIAIGMAVEDGLFSVIERRTLGKWGMNIH